jgi:hypothetical protein
MNDKIGYIYDENGNPISKPTVDVRDFERSNVSPEEFPDLVEKMRVEILRRSGFKMDANGKPMIDNDGNEVVILPVLDSLESSIVKLPLLVKLLVVVKTNPFKSNVKLSSLAKVTS